MEYLEKTEIKVIFYDEINKQKYLNQSKNKIIQNFFKFISIEQEKPTILLTKNIWLFLNVRCSQSDIMKRMCIF